MRNLQSISILISLVCSRSESSSSANSRSYDRSSNEFHLVSPKRNSSSELASSSSTSGFPFKKIRGGLSSSSLPDFKGKNLTDHFKNKVNFDGMKDSISKGRSKFQEDFAKKVAEMREKIKNRKLGDLSASDDIVGPKDSITKESFKFGKGFSSDSLSGVKDMLGKNKIGSAKERFSEMFKKMRSRSPLKGIESDNVSFE